MRWLVSKRGLARYGRRDLPGAGYSGGPKGDDDGRLEDRSLVDLVDFDQRDSGLAVCSGDLSGIGARGHRKNQSGVR
jgi:hypothetical protein